MPEPREEAIARWHRNAHPTHYPDPTDQLVCGKLAEEAGEVNGAAIRISECRGTLDDLAGEIGDVLMCLAVIAGRHGWRLADLLEAKWVEHGQDNSPRFVNSDPAGDD